MLLSRTDKALWKLMKPSVLGSWGFLSTEIRNMFLSFSSLSEPLEAHHWCLGRCGLDLCRSVFRDAARGHIWLRGSHDKRHLYRHLWLHHQFRRHNLRHLDDSWHLTCADRGRPHSSYIHPIFILYSSIFCFHLLHFASVWHFAICNWWCVLCRFCIGLSQSASQLFSLFPLALALECCWLDVTLCALILGELTHGLWCRLPRLLKLGLLKWWTACTSILPWLSA